MQKIRMLQPCGNRGAEGNQRDAWLPKISQLVYFFKDGGGIFEKKIYPRECRFENLVA